MKLLKIIFISFSLLTTNICLAENSSSLIEQAEKARVKASEAGYEWSTTSILINNAKQAAKDGNEALATELAQKAILEAKNSLKQEEYANKNWQKAEPKL